MKKSLIRHRDGHWRFTQMPTVAFKLCIRLLKRDQKFVNLSPGKKFAMPYSLPTAKGHQTPKDGAGPFFYKRYTADIAGAELTPELIMARIQADPDDFSPKSLARYIKTKGKRGQMRVGDEFFIGMTGPWNGPVRVVAVSPRSFTFVTLRDHMEAGEIHFKISKHTAQHLRFEIQSWARSRDAGVDLFYDKLKVAQLVQAEMWTSFSENVVKFSKGHLVKSIVIATQRKNRDSSSKAA